MYPLTARGKVSPRFTVKPRPLAVFFLLVCGVSLFARGKREEDKIESQNAEFTLCITAFDVSALPPGQQAMGAILQRELALDLGRIHYRQRSGDEIAHYKELAWIGAKIKAASRLAAKREERDALLYSGAPDWKYKKELRRIEKELEELEAAYKKAEEDKPLIAETPVFKLSEVNTGSAAAFPPPPPRGGEEAFLTSHNADALLEGTFRLLYGRIYADFRVFIRGASFVYEDSVIFSPEDLNAASDELKLRFMAAVANSEPARITLRAEPDKALLEINGRPVQSGETLKLPPGPVTVRAAAENHKTEQETLEMEAGDAKDIAFALKPFTMETLDIVLPGPGSSVYMGAFYLGGNKETAAQTVETAETTAAAEKPKPGLFSVYVPVGQYRYIRVDTEDGLTDEVIVKGSSEDNVRIITPEPRKLPGKDEKPVEAYRKKFYGAYGRFWIALPLAFLVNGIYQLYYNNYYLAAVTSGDQSLYGKATNAYYVSAGAWSVAGLFLVESLVRMVIYIRTASKESIPLWKQNKKL